MARHILILLLLLALAPPALAWSPPFAMDDPLARRIAAGASHETGMLGPYCAMVSIFAVKEPGGRGVRLYVGLVDDIYDQGSRVRMWRGPVADGWRKLTPVPEYTANVTKPNPARYRITREEMAPGGRRHDSLMEIDLESNPSRVKLVDAKPSVPGDQDFLPLEEMTPLSDTMRILPRLFRGKSFVNDSLRLTSYEIWLGRVAPPPKRPPEIEAWQTILTSHLLLVSPCDRPEKAKAYFLPMRPDGWTLNEMSPASTNNRGQFNLEMFAGYFYPNREGSLTVRYSRNLVTAGMDGISVTNLETGYVYDVATELFIKERRTATPKKR